jgi:hypothetical protein
MSYLFKKFIDCQVNNFSFGNLFYSAMNDEKWWIPRKKFRDILFGEWGTPFNKSLRFDHRYF